MNRFTLILALLVSTLGLSAQDLAVTGTSNFYVSNGTTVGVTNGNVLVYNSATLENQGNLFLSGNLDVSGQVKGAGGAFRFVGPLLGQAYKAGTSDTLGKIEVNKPIGDLNIQSHTFVVLDSLRLVKGLMNTTVSNLVQIQCTTGIEAPVISSPVSFVNGPMQIAFTRDFVTGSYPIPIGTGTSYVPFSMINATVNTIGVGPYNNIIQEYEVFKAPFPVGSAGSGIAKLNNEFQYKVTAATASTNWDLNHDWTLYYTPEFNMGTFVTNYKSIVFAQNLSAVGNGVYTAISNKNATNDLSTGSVSSSGLKFKNEKYFLQFGACRAELGALSLDNAIVCQGDTNTVTAPGANGATLDWYVSTDGGSNYSFVKNAKAFGTPRVLNTTTRVRGIFPDPDCEADTTDIDVPMADRPKVRLKAYLQGAYDAVGDTMFTKMRPQGVTPAQFVNLDSIYLYNGTPDPNRMWAGYAIPENAVDIVVVELRNKSNASLIEGKAKAWLLSNGTMVDFNTGQDSYIGFCGELNGLYNLVVSHRNHLSVMYNVPQNVDNNLPPDLDLTDWNNIFKKGAQKLKVSGPTVLRAGMIAGNCENSAFAKGQVNVLDFYNVYVVSQTLPQAYFMEDVNLDGVTNAADYTLTSNNNDNLPASTVPGDQ
jgi:hypothetical protein